MKAYWKTNPHQVGIVTRVYVTDAGQKRMEVRFPYSTVDAEIREFEIANN